ncbi:S8 family serine peptidase [Pontibacter sp. G13]|uniref:S8 family serine peptidase n=1 Tax=Pontibacter sp. G13 TaxID=3074898 RepID=UPI00288B2CBA|nr:S8 family serine peptidase [Pontibacter sp. G13]WNJ21209.1 S8 family serine peptidase [Pontibacter sp. G13]
MKRPLTILIAILCGYIGAFAQSHKISESLLTKMSEAPNQPIAVSILLRNQAPVNYMMRDFEKRQIPQSQRVPQVIAALKQQVNATQPSLIATLKQTVGVEVASIQPLWIVNGVFATMTPAAIQTLSQNPDVEWIDFDQVVLLERDDTPPVPATPQPGFREPGLTAVNAPAMWALGYTGYGRRALSVDTGVDPTHPALKDRWVGNFFPASQGWLDVYGNEETTPSDCDNHGTHTTGTMLGLDPVTQDTIGVATQALWMGMQGICSGSNLQSRISLGFQWALDPDGDSTTVYDMPDVINNSWYHPGLSNECNSFYLTLFDALEAAGIAVVFSAGNEGNGVGTITAPKNINTDTVSVFSVGNLNGYSQSFPIANSSSRGPSACGGVGSLLIKPEVSAPGVNVRSCHPGGIYVNFTGTSMAAPHVSGAILLLKEAFPYLSGRQLKLALYYTAVDIGAIGEDNDYGMGIIDVYAAYQYLVARGNTPATPQTTVDATLESEFQAVCGTNGATTYLLTNSGSVNLDSAQISFRLDDNTPVSFAWNGSLAPGQSTMVELPIDSLSLGKHQIFIQVTDVNDQEDYLFLNSTLTQDLIVLEAAQVSAQDSVPVCGASEGFLTAEVDNELAEISWYDAPTGGNLIGSGPYFWTQPLATSTTFYASAQIASKGGIEIEEVPTGGLHSQSKLNGIEFETFYDATIQSVAIHTILAGPQEILLRDVDGTLLDIFVTDALQPGRHVIPVNFSVEADQTYQMILGFNSTGGLYTTTTDVSFPYSVGGVVSLLGIPGSLVPSTTYFFFYDWEVSYETACPRQPVTAALSPGVAIAQAFANTQVLDLDQAQANVQFFQQSLNAQSQIWNFGDGTQDTSSNPVHAYYQAGEYVVTLQITNAEGCTDSDTLHVSASGTYPFPISVDPELPESAWQVYPNPVQDKLTIAWESPLRPTAFRLFDVSGKRLMEWNPQQSIGTSQISMQALPEGVYLLQMEVNGQTYFRKILRSTN